MNFHTSIFPLLVTFNERRIVMGASSSSAANMMHVCAVQARDVLCLYSGKSLSLFISVS